MTDAAAPCPFCQVVLGALPARVVHESATTLAFLDLAPANPGHTLVVPKAHAADLLGAAPEQLAAVALATQAVARLLIERLGAQGVTVVQTNRSAGWQEVFHLHVHVVPRYHADALRTPWRPHLASNEDLDAAFVRLTE